MIAESSFSPVKVKICGLRRKEDILMVNELKPDYIGFVFAGSKRQISRTQARELKNLLAPDILAVGVFVDAPQDEILTLLADGSIDIIQLHGHEDISYIQTLKEKTTATTIKAVRVKDKQDIIKASDLPVDYLLLDTYKKGEMGGSGITFDWNLIPPDMKPYFLAGGLDAANITTAIHELSPYCLDVSSKVETDGYKDYEKVAAFIKAVREEK